MEPPLRFSSGILWNYREARSSVLILELVLPPVEGCLDLFLKVPQVLSC